MTQGEIDVAWSRSVAASAAATLVAAKIVAASDLDRILEIVAEEISVRLAIGDRPTPENWRYKSN